MKLLKTSFLCLMLCLMLFFFIPKAFPQGLSLLSSTRVRVLWVQNTKTKVYTKPLVKDDILYYGDLLNNFYALRATEGSLLWQKKLKSRKKGKLLGIQSSFAVYDNTIVLVNKDGFLYSFEQKTGKLVWGPIDLGEVVYSSPVVMEHYIFIVVGRVGRLFIIDAKSGREHSLNEPVIVGSPVYTSPAISNVYLERAFKDKLYNVYITLPRKIFVFRINIKAGVKTDVRSLDIANEANYISSPIIHSMPSKKSLDITIKTVFFASKSYIYSIDANLFTINWINRTDAVFINEDRVDYPAPFIAEGKLFFISRAYDIVSGSPLWNVFLYGVPTTDATFYKEKGYIGGKYYSYGSIRGYISVVSLKTEDIILFKELSAYPLSPITVANGVIYLSTNDNRLFALK